MDRFARFGLTAGAIGGIALALGAALRAADAADPLSQQVATTPFVIATLLRLAGGTGLLLGVTGITARCAARSGALLYVGYVFAVAGLVLNLGWIWADLFVSDTLAELAPAVLDGGGPDLGTRLGTGFLAAWLANVGLAVLAVGVARTRTVPRWSWIALFTSGVVTLVPLPVDGEVFEVFIALPFTVAMVLALAPLRSPRPARETVYDAAA